MVASENSAELEAALRVYRRGELLNRRRPSTVRVLLDVASRFIPLGICVLVLLLNPSLPVAMVASAVCGIVVVSLVGSWYHELLHNNLRLRWPTRTVLRAVAAGPLALSNKWWRVKHLQGHHPHPKDPDLDPDIQFGALARVVSGQRSRAIHRYQHVSFWLLSPFATIAMLSPMDIFRLYQSPLGAGRWAAARSLADKYTIYTVVWGILLGLHGLAAGLVIWLSFHCASGIAATLITQAQHNAGASEVPANPAAHKLLYQLRVTNDVGRPSGLWWWISGGTTLHVVHHLVPQLTFLELPGATRRLRMTLAEFDDQIPHYPNMRMAVRAHRTRLHELSRFDPILAE